MFGGETTQEIVLRPHKWGGGRPPPPPQHDGTCAAVWKSVLFCVFQAPSERFSFFVCVKDIRFISRRRLIQSVIKPQISNTIKLFHFYMAQS